MPDTARFILNRLTEWGIERVYGYPGDGINGLIGAFHELGDRLEFIQCRHEEIASFAATAHAKFTGEVGVCMATSGPGAIHLLNGLYDAKLDHQPVVAIIGQQKRMSLGANYQQEVDLNTLYKDVASEYVMTVMDPSQARHVIDRAIRIALDSRQPTAVIVPEDVQEAEYQDPPRAHGAVFSSLGFSKPLMRRTKIWRARRRSSTRARRSRCSSARAPPRLPTRSCRWPSSPVPAWPRRSTVARPCPTISRSSPDRSGCSGPSRATT